MASSPPPFPPPPEQVDADLDAPFDGDVLLEVRTSRMKTMPGLKVQSGIDKQIRQGRVPVTLQGLDGDEHDLTFHGGRDKAVHGYCSSHYPKWRAEYPSATAAFRPGGFGENLVTARMNERNVCIGDVVAIVNPASVSAAAADDGIPEDAVLLEVSLPRQPCFKLNHRFRLPNFAPQTWRHSRTGWYYRVLRGGGAGVAAGDVVRLAARPNPAWTVERVQQYLHREQANAEANAALASSVAQLGEESRGQFRRRVEAAERRRAREERRLKRRLERAGVGGEEEDDDDDDDDETGRWRTYRIARRRAETPRIASLVLEAEPPLAAEPAPLSLGSHVRLRLRVPDDEDGTSAEAAAATAVAGEQPKKTRQLIRSYSVVAGKDMSRFELGVALEPESRGASAWLHAVPVSTSEDDVDGEGSDTPGGSEGRQKKKKKKNHPLVEVFSRPTQSVRPALSASAHVFVAGGIGLTAFLRAVEACRAINLEAVLHYAVRDLGGFDIDGLDDDNDDASEKGADSRGQGMSDTGDVPFASRLRALRRSGPDPSHTLVYGPRRTGSGAARHEDRQQQQQQLDADDAAAAAPPRKENSRLDLPRIMSTLPWNAHLYVCGPRRMMDEARREADRLGLRAGDDVHFEAFGGAEVGGDPFEAEVIVNSGGGSSSPDNKDGGGDEDEDEDEKPRQRPRVLLRVGADETLLGALRRGLRGRRRPEQLRGGATAGRARCGVRGGRVEHRGAALADEDRRGSMLSCVSRGVGRIVVEV